MHSHGNFIQKESSGGINAGETVGIRLEDGLKAVKAGTHMDTGERYTPGVPGKEMQARQEQLAKALKAVSGPEQKDKMIRTADVKTK